MNADSLQSSCTRIATRILADQVNSYEISRPLSTGDVARMVHLAVRAGAHAGLTLARTHSALHALAGGK